MKYSGNISKSNVHVPGRGTRKQYLLHSRIGKRLCSDSVFNWVGFDHCLFHVNTYVPQSFYFKVSLCLLTSRPKVLFKLT